MIAIALQSGSSGNSIYIESCSTGLLFDAGISGIEAERRLAAHGRDIRKIAAVILSHDHSDHVRYAGIYQRKYGLPLFFTKGTLHAAEAKMDLGKLNKVTFFSSGDMLRFGDVSVMTVPTPHDGKDGSAFIVSANQKKLGILTDLGHVFDGLPHLIAGLDAVFIESNYDSEMLANGPYPYHLRKRIHGPGGHISNIEAATLLLSGKRLKWACLAHLSGQNNDPKLALETHRSIIGEAFPVFTASRYSATGIFSL